MARPTRNPFYVILGLAGFLFTITASSYCLSVLRGVRPETAADHGGHAFERIMDRHGTAILTGELVLLAFATVGAVAVDHAAGRRELAARQAAADRSPPPSRGADEP
ncbi:MAG: hypothetical protein DWI03_02425 [Planctomycetota bacterium]|jgi:hypothetical protein|nr:MAG: hypothetical protein DWI03_02425 [Planctomycetota bacterium]